MSRAATFKRWLGLRFPITAPPPARLVLLFLGMVVPESLSIHFLGTDTPIWVTNAVAVAMLFRSSTSTWPGFLLCAMLADTTAGLLFGDGPAVSLGTALCDGVEIVLISWTLRRIETNAPIFSSVGQISRSALTCVVVPALTAVGGAILLNAALGSPFGEVWVTWYLSAIFGHLIVVPFLLIWTEPSQKLSVRERSNWEVFALALLVGVVGGVDFTVQALPGMFLCFPVLLIAAFRGGILGATTAAIVLTVVASWVTLSGWGPIATVPGVTTVQSILLLQLYLAAVLLSTLPVAVMLEQRKLLNAFETHAELSRMARHDMLTGLPNRILFQERLAWVQAQSRREGGHAALLLFDLDRFKPVNDLHGHAAGDRLLQMVAERLRSTARETDTVARLGGDEFALIARMENPEAAQRLAQRVIVALGQPFEFQDLKVQVGCSVGIALSPRGGIEAEFLVKRADAALYRAKAEGRNCFRFFENGMDEVVRKRAELETELRQAVSAGSFVPFYQPIVKLGSGDLVGFEMLARWTHPTLGKVSPAVFIPLAESTGLMATLCESLFRSACRTALTWPDDLFVTVNVSPVQLRDRMLPELVRSILAETGLPPRRLEIELTESALIDDFELAHAILVDLKSTGIRLALDDFGTGYSSLRHLQELPLDKIKIDIGFVRSMASVVASRKIVAGVIGLGHSLGLPIVAEGIEDAVAAEMLVEMGCDLGQGWLYGRAKPASEVADMLLALTDSGSQREAATATQSG